MKRLEEYEISSFTPQEPVSDPQISRDGIIAFTYTIVNYEENRYDSSIHVKRPGEKEKRLTSGNSDSTPRWSPDGKSLLFLSGREPVEGIKGKQLWLISPDGGEAKRITRAPMGVRSPVWSPKGKWIYFISEVVEGEVVEDSDIKIIRRIHYKYDPGREIYAGRRLHLFKVDLKGKIDQLTSGEYDVKDITVHPNGESVEFISNMDEYADLTWFKNIYSLDIKSKKLTTLFSGEENGVGNMSKLGWSPDRKKLAFSGRPMESMEYVKYQNQELFVLESEKLLNPTENLDRRIGVSSIIPWSSDSKYVYFTKPEAGSRHLCKVDLKGGIETLTEGKFNVGGFAVAENCIALTYTATGAPSELFTLKDGEVSKETELSSSPEGFTAPEEYWFTASDGVHIQGWIIPPKKQESGKKYPTILQIHGGPRVHFGYMYGGAEHEFQILSDHGYAVVYTNPRGSIGYGEEFSGIIQGSWGDRDYKDLMEAMDYITKKYDYIDAVP